MRMRIQLGKTYRTLDGDLVKIVDDTGLPTYKWRGSNGKSYTKYGCIRKETRTQSDLIACVEEPETATVESVDEIKARSMSEQKMRETFEVWWRAVLNDPYRDVGFNDEHVARLAWYAALAQSRVVVRAPNTIAFGNPEKQLPVYRQAFMSSAHQPVELTDDDIVAIAKKTKSAEPGRDGYILPITFARAVIAAHEAKKNGVAR